MEPRNYTDEDKKNLITIWQTVIEVQKHFNEIEIKIRNFAITIFTFFLGGIAFSLKEGYYIYKFGFIIPFVSIIAVVGGLVIMALYVMDKHWYHRLLHGSVEQGLAIEKEIKKIFPYIGLTTKIKESSPNSMLFFLRDVHSGGKLRIFYYIQLIILSVIFIMTVFFGKEMLLQSEYRQFKKDLKQVDSSSFGSIQPKPGIMLVLDRNGKLFFVTETRKLNNFIQLYLERNSEILKDKKVYFAEVKIARKELEELILESKFKLND